MTLSTILLTGLFGMFVFFGCAAITCAAIDAFRNRGNRECLEGDLWAIAINAGLYGGGAATCCAAMM